MKKITALLVILTLLTSVGCSAADEAEDAVNFASSAPGTTAPDTETAAISDSAVTESEATSATDAPEETGLAIHTESFTSEECYVTLAYPFYGDGEHNAFDVAMYNYAMQKYSQSGMIPDEGAVYEITDCDVKYESEKLVSAVMIGHIFSPTAAHDTNFAYTVNADPMTGRLYLSDELIGELELLKTAMHEGRFAKSYGIDGLESAIADKVVTYEVMTQSWRSDYGVFPQMYFTEDNFGVMAELPHVVGGYAGFELPYRDTGDMLSSTAKELIATTD